MRDENNRTRAIITVLTLIIVLLLGVVAYFLWLKPSYEANILEKQKEAYLIGQQDLLSGILGQLQQRGYVQLNLAENQTLYMAPFNPEQTAQQGALQQEPSLTA